ncbi:MAG: sugar transferase [Acidobacteriota bacterium]
MSHRVEHGSPERRRPRGLPRAIDATLAALGLWTTAPLLGLAALAVRATSPGPILFRQTRIGRGGRPFTLLKLRTMRRDGDGDGAAVTAAGDRRVTTIGRVLRKTKLDELPQLWNVLRGDLALVGPRPEVPRFVDRDDDAWRDVLAVRPGLTDPVTLRLRNEEAVLRALGGEPEEAYRRLLPWKLAGAREAQARRSALGDLGVLAATIRAILRPLPTPDLHEIECAADLRDDGPEPTA